MKKIDTVRALRDAEYRDTLTADQLASLPAHPAGASDITDNTLKSVVGGCAGSACQCGPGPTTFVFSCVPPGSHCP